MAVLLRIRGPGVDPVLLYKIATNVCLTALAPRPIRVSVSLGSEERWPGIKVWDPSPADAPLCLNPSLVRSDLPISPATRTGPFATRAIQGAGGGLAVPLSLVLISESSHPSSEPGPSGSGARSPAWRSLSPPLAGGAIVSGLAWRWIFWVNVPIGVAVLASGLTCLARSPKVSARIDLAGMLLGAFAVGAIAYAVQEGPTVGWTSAQVLTAGIGGLVLAGATMAWERRRAYPMVPPGLLANRSFAAAAAGRFCLGVAPVRRGLPVPAVPPARASLQPHPGGDRVSGLDWREPVRGTDRRADRSAAR